MASCRLVQGNSHFPFPLRMKNVLDNTFSEIIDRGADEITVSFFSLPERRVHRTRRICSVKFQLI